MYRNLGIIFIIVGIGLSVFTIYSVIVSMSASLEMERVRDLDVMVDATVTDVWTEIHTHKPKNGARYSTTYYYGSVEYEYNGNKYKNPNVSFETISVHRGQNVKVYIDPDNPSYSFFYRHKDETVSLIITYIVLGAFSAISFAAAVKMFKISKKFAAEEKSSSERLRQEIAGGRSYYNPNTPYSSNGGGMQGQGFGSDPYNTNTPYSSNGGGMQGQGFGGDSYNTNTPYSSNGGGMQGQGYGGDPYNTNMPYSSNGGGMQGQGFGSDPYNTNTPYSSNGYDMSGQGYGDTPAAYGQNDTFPQTGSGMQGQGFVGGDDPFGQDQTFSSR